MLKYFSGVKDRDVRIARREGRRNIRRRQTANTSQGFLIAEVTRTIEDMISICENREKKYPKKELGRRGR